MNTNLTGQGLELMLVGMGTVFAFLSLLVLATVVMSYFVQRFQPIADDVGVSAEEVAAILIAIARHRGDC